MLCIKADKTPSISFTWICIKAATNKTAFKQSQLLCLEKALAFQESQVLWEVNFQVWMWNLCVRNFVEGEGASSAPAVWALCKEIAHGSISLNLLTVICPLLTRLHTLKNIFSFEKSWYGNLLNIGSVKPKLKFNVIFSWTYEKTYKLILKNALRTEMIQKY